MRILCLDIGTKRIGVAVSDPMGWIAQPVEVIARKDDVQVMDRIAALCREYEPVILLVGLPLDAEGGMGFSAKKIQAFANHIKQYLQSIGIEIPMKMWDERYSTVTAEERLIEADVSRAKRRKIRDKLAAQAILQGWMDAQSLT